MTAPGCRGEGRTTACAALNCAYSRCFLRTRPASPALPASCFGSSSAPASLGPPAHAPTGRFAAQQGLPWRVTVAPHAEGCMGTEVLTMPISGHVMSHADCKVGRGLHVLHQTPGIMVGDSGAATGAVTHLRCLWKHQSPRAARQVSAPEGGAPGSGVPLWLRLPFSSASSWSCTCRSSLLNVLARSDAASAAPVTFADEDQDRLPGLTP